MPPFLSSSAVSWTFFITCSLQKENNYLCQADCGTYMKNKRENKVQHKTETYLLFRFYFLYIHICKNCTFSTKPRCLLLSHFDLCIVMYNIPADMNSSLKKQLVASQYLQCCMLFLTALFFNFLFICGFFFSLLHFLGKINSKTKYHIFTFKTCHYPFLHSHFCYTKTWYADFSIYSETPFKIPWHSWKGHSQSQRSRSSPAMQADPCFLLLFFIILEIHK